MSFFLFIFPIVVLLPTQSNIRSTLEKVCHHEMSRGKAGLRVVGCLVITDPSKMSKRKSIFKILVLSQNHKFNFTDIITTRTTGTETHVKGDKNLAGVVYVYVQ